MNSKIEKAVWEPRFSVGNHMSDKHHQKLLELCEELRLCLQDAYTVGNQHLQVILENLCSYAQEHFREEERLLAQHNYPDLTAHQAEHNEYMLQLRGFLTEATHGTCDKERLQPYLTEWWSRHILVSDMRFSKFLALRPPLWL